MGSGLTRWDATAVSGGGAEERMNGEMAVKKEEVGEKWRIEGNERPDLVGGFAVKGKDRDCGEARGMVMDTLYLGGGTPSYLDECSLEMIVGKVHDIWRLSVDSECSVEMNPEDAERGKLQVLRELGFNRLTIGVQSFNDDVLKRINRTHSAEQAIRAVENAKKAGFDNVGIDLIIGLPGEEEVDLKKDLEYVNRLDINHVSVYILSIDSNSVFERLSERGRFQVQDDDVLADRYMMVCNYLKNIGFEHYEISNFARDLKYSRHNMSYWTQVPYIGLGPAAHSFDGESRQWNVAHLKRYMDALDKGQLDIEKEVLTERDKFNECLMTNLRTMWGIDGKCVSGKWPEWWQTTVDKLERYGEECGWVERCDGRWRLTERGWLVSDGIFSDLFV